jgi:hypothetical protein
VRPPAIVERAGRGRSPSPRASVSHTIVLAGMTIYVELTREFNRGRLRAVICSGQAVVLHRLAIMSKDGDWILREDAETLQHVLEVLERHGARYRFGAPLDVAWMRGGWSAHFEFQHAALLGEVHARPMAAARGVLPVQICPGAGSS